MHTEGVGLSTLDYGVFILYVLIIISVGLWVSRNKKGEKKGTKDYFLAGKTLPWWAIGSSLIAANISAEQFIGMSGSGFSIGLAIASYEWMAALTLIIVAKYFMPIFIDKGIFTIPEFVEKRFNRTLKTILAVFWLALFVFVNLNVSIIFRVVSFTNYPRYPNVLRYFWFGIVCGCLLFIWWPIGSRVD